MRGQGKELEFPPVGALTLLPMPSNVGKVLGSELSPPPGSPPHCPVPLSESLCWPEAGQPLGRRAKRTLVGSRSLSRREEVGGCRGEEWPHTQSILGEEQGSQEGPPWVWLSVQLHTGCCPGGSAGQSGCRSLLVVLLLSTSKLLRERSRVPVPDGAVRDCGLLAGRSHHCGLPCTHPHFGGKAAGRSLIGPAGERAGGVGGGARRVDACVCFQF